MTQGKQLVRELAVQCARYRLAVPTKRACECGHGKRDHTARLICVYPGCYCNQYRKVSA
jgi:hypothetical protein